MVSQINLPDEVCLNEILISKESVLSISVRKFSFDPAQRMLLSKPIREGNFVSVFSGPDCVFLMTTKKQETSITDKLSKEVNLQPDAGVKVVGDLPNEIARRLIFTLIQKSAEAQGMYRGDGWQLFSLNENTEVPNGYFAVNIDIRAEQDYYHVYLDPTLVILLPLTSLTPQQLYSDRSLLRIVASADERKMEQWGHSCHPGHVGFFVSIDQGSSSIDRTKHLAPDIPILLKRTLQSTDAIRYPAFALRVVATMSEVDALGLTKQQRRKTQPLPHFRLQKTQEWVNKVFPNNVLMVNDRQIGVDNRTSDFQQASRYSPQQTGQLYVWYPETRLLFNRQGNKTHFSQIGGLREYGPFDQNLRTRPFNEIRPYLILPNDSRCAQLSTGFFNYLANGYKRRTETDFADDNFEGISSKFHVKFLPPEGEDILAVDGSLTDYEQKAGEILRRWTINENRSNNRIAVVVLPNLYNDDTDGDSQEDPYGSVKKIFIEGGLPSQMIKLHKLDGVDDESVAFGHLLWTFALDLYVKLGGKPWTLYRPLGNVNCLIGLGFGRNRQAVQNPIYVGIANVFDDGGQWLSLASNDRELTKEDILSLENREYEVIGTNSFKLHQEFTYKLINDTLASYATPSPSRAATKVVLHKNGRIYEPEVIGFLQAFAQNMQNRHPQISAARFALVSLYKMHGLRMYGPAYPNANWPMKHTVTRGSVRILNSNTALVATTGKNPIKYPGIGTPRPILVERYVPSEAILKSSGLEVSQMYTIEEICEQILALTKLHWGTTRDIRLPITSEYAQRIARFVAKTRVRVDLLLRWQRLWWV